jgi:3-oxoacyl-[acyl-carrier protein] reductase
MHAQQAQNLTSLNGKVAWITGSSRGIGKAIAEHFAFRGAKVVIHGSRSDSPNVFGEGASLAANAGKIAQTCQTTCIAVAGDLTDYGVVQNLVSEIREQLGSIDILVNCAGGDIGGKGVRAEMAGKPAGNDALAISPEDIGTVMDRNFLTCVLCCKAVVPDMMARRGGRVVNIGSIAALAGIPGSVIYASAKAAVHEYSRCLAVQLRPYDITVNVVAPGDTVTERFLASRKTEDSRKVHSGTLERYGWPLEIASAVEFLASDAARFISGQVIRVDGGSQCWPA